jgi:GTPase SAR1 family protein
MSPAHRLDVKAIMLGDSSVGKSTLVASYEQNCYNPHMTSTIGIEFRRTVLNVHDTAAHVQVWGFFLAFFESYYIIIYLR